MTEISNAENLYLLLGQIPKERMYSTGGSPIASLVVRDEDEYVRSCFYQKGKIGENSIALGSWDNNDAAPHYYFSYNEGEEQNISEAFISMQEFLASATYINRRFRITEAAIFEILGGAIPDNYGEILELEERFLICALGDKALIKKDAHFISGYEVIDISRTPLNSESFEFTTDVEKTDILPNEIIDGIKRDLRGEIIVEGTIYTP